VNSLFSSDVNVVGSRVEMADMPLGVAGFGYRDTYNPQKLAELYDVWEAEFLREAPAEHATFAAYRACGGVGMKPEAVSDALLAAAPHVSKFVATLFGVEAPVATLANEVRDRSPLWVFKRDFAKKKVQKESPPPTKEALEQAARISRAVLGAPVPGADEELHVARTVVALVEVDDVARKAAKSGGAEWTEPLRERGRALIGALLNEPTTADTARSHLNLSAPESASDAELASAVALALDAIAMWLRARWLNHHDRAHRWPSLHAPKNLDYNALVQIRRPTKEIPELFVGPDHERRERDGFKLSDRRATAREVEQEIDYCLYCHGRDKDSCSKGLRENKTGEIKANPLGVPLNGCPLEEKISEMHVMRRDGDPLAALSLVCIDNPMCPGTGHRICNDCMKACVFQKQEPVNIPQIETRVLSEVLGLPWGLEIYGFLTRWNPLNVKRPYNLPYNGRNVLVVGLGPAGYTLAHHLTREGFGVVAVDGLKIEPLPATIVNKPLRDFTDIYTELDERLLLGFGGVSEYGITVRWDKNFLTVLYMTLSRNPLLSIYGGVRFGGTLTLEDAWGIGFDHVAIAAGAGRPTIIDMKNNLSRGIRKASDFLMGLQLTGAYKKSSIANLQVSLPAIVIGGGLTAIDTATELLAYYPIQIEKTAQRYRDLVRQFGDAHVRKLFDDEEWETLCAHMAHAAELDAEYGAANREGRMPRVQQLLDKWGGVTLVYRKGLGDSPAYRLNHEEVAKSLEEGVRYIEDMSPIEAVLDARGHVKGMKFVRADKSIVELPARTVCVAAGTSPNITYEKEYEGTFKLDSKGRYFQSYDAAVGSDGKLSLTECAPQNGFFTSYNDGKHAVSFYGDNHAHYAGSVVKAMASGKDGYSHVAKLFPEIRTLSSAGQPARDSAWEMFRARIHKELSATVVRVNRLTDTIVEVVVHAPLAARKFQPGQFYRLQNFEAMAPVVDGTRLAMEGLALTGAWVDPEKGEMGTIVLEMGGSSRLCAALRPGEPVVLMGPTGAPTEIKKGETVLLCGGGLGNAVLFSIARAFKTLGATVVYFAGYKRGEDLFKQDDIEAFTDLVIWTTDSGKAIEPRRPNDRHFRGNIVEAMIAYGKGELGGPPPVRLSKVNRIIAIGSDRMMAAVKEARHNSLAQLLDPKHLALGSINSPMQCMMKEVCAQCLQKQVDPQTGKEVVVFTCYNQDQELDRVDFAHLRERLRANSMQEKLTNAWFDHLLTKRADLIRV